MCGADDGAFYASVMDKGSPPRVRSRLSVRLSDGQRLGITSACAEQTNRYDDIVSIRKDHLRVCGADEVDLFEAMCHQGSPPRVRSRRRRMRFRSVRPGITSACAEQTAWRKP